jgi:hypothetical protein
MKTEFELIRLTKANEYLTKALELLNQNDALLVGGIIKTNYDKINYHNKQELDVINPTNKELGSISSSLKKIVVGVYLNPIKVKLEKEIGVFSFSDKYNNHYCENDKECICANCVKEMEKEDIFYVNKSKLMNPFEILYTDVLEKCNKTQLPKEILNAKILLSRNNPNFYSYNKIETELNEYLKLKMLESFNEQNKDFIKTRILSHTGA